MYFTYLGRCKHVGMPLTSRSSATVHSLQVSASDVTHLLWHVYAQNSHPKLRDAFYWHFPFNKINIINYFIQKNTIRIDEQILFSKLHKPLT